MKEEQKNAVKRVAAAGALVGIMAVGGAMAAQPASAATMHAASASVLTNVTPASTPVLPGENGTCCMKARNIACC